LQGPDLDFVQGHRVLQTAMPLENCCAFKCFHAEQYVKHSELEVLNFSSSKKLTITHTAADEDRPFAMGNVERQF